MAIEGYWQEKDDEPRTVFIPERWVWNGPGPSVAWYLQHVRPAFEPATDEPHYFLTSDGTPWESSEGYRITMQRAIKKVLGYSIGAHAFRRFCATLRTLYGWSLEEVAEHLHDRAHTVYKHYIDHNFVRYVRAQGFRPPKGDRVALPVLWKLPEKLGLTKLP